MGLVGSKSSTQDLLDVKKHARFNNAPPEVLSWVQETGDCILGFAGCLHTLSQQVEKSAVSYMTKAEKNTFCELEAAKISLVGRIKMFIMKERLRFQMMSDEAKIGLTVSELTRNVRPEQHCAEIGKLQEDLTLLQTKYKNFSAELQENCRLDGRNTTGGWKNILTVVAGVATVVAGITAVVLLMIHFAAGIPLILTPLGWAVVGGCGCVVVTGGTILSVTLQPTEIDRALGYMKELQKNLEKLKTSMGHIEAHATVLTEHRQLEGFQNCAKELVNQCKNVEKICDEVSRQAFCT